MCRKYSSFLLTFSPPFRSPAFSDHTLYITALPLFSLPVKRVIAPRSKTSPCHISAEFYTGFTSLAGSCNSRTPRGLPTILRNCNPDLNCRLLLLRMANPTPRMPVLSIQDLDPARRLVPDLFVKLNESG